VSRFLLPGILLALLLAVGFLLFYSPGDSGGKGKAGEKENPRGGLASLEAGRGPSSAAVGPGGQEEGGRRLAAGDLAAGEGLVVDEDGHAVRGAEIGLAAARAPLARSGPDGRFSVPEDLPGSDPRIPLRIYARGFLPAERVVARGQPWLITLEHGGRLAITVRDHAGNPLGGAVTLALRSGNHRRKEKTDGSGHLTTSGWPPGPLEVSWKDFPLAESDPLVPGKLFQMEVRLPDLDFGLVAGRVVSGGRPIAGARVQLLEEEDLKPEPVLTGEDGRFQLSAPARGDSLLLAEAEGFVPAVHRIDEVNRKGGVELVVELETGRRLPGRVVSLPARAPVPGAAVRVRMQLPIQGSVPGMDPGKRKNRVVEFAADEKGVFLSPPIPLKNPSSFQATLDEVSSGWVKRKPGEDAEVVLELGVVVHVVGKVLDPLGKPILDARLGRRDDYKAHHVHYMRNVWTVDKEGNFDVLVPPKYQDGFWLVASAPGCQPNGVFLENLTGGVPAQVTITLQPGSAGRLIGTVHDADGQPVFDARVRARPKGQKNTWNTRTDHFGRWWLESLPPGSFTLFVDKPPEGLAAGKLEVQTDRTDLELVLAGPRFLEVTLVPPPGFPGGTFLADAILQWDGGTRWASVEDLDKPLRFEAPPAGTEVRVAIYPDSKLAPKVEGPFVLKERDLEEGIRLQLENGFRVAGRAILPQGTVLAPGSFRARLVWTEPSVGRGFGGGSTSDLDGEEHADGSFEFLHVPPGRMQILLSAQNTKGQPLVGDQVFTVTGDGQFVEVPLRLGRRRLSPQGAPGDPFR